MSIEINEYINGSDNNNGDFYSISKYIPLMTYVSLYPITTELELISLVLQKPTLGSADYVYGNSSTKILDYLSTSSFLRPIKTNGLIIYVGKGTIYDEKSNVLLSLTVETQFVLDMFIRKDYNWSSLFEVNRNFVGYDAFVMFVSSEFANDKKFAVLYRRIKKIYLDFCFEKGIEMRLISSSKIKENTFTNNLKIKFDSLTELNRHLTEDVKHLLQTPLESFQEKEFPLLLVSPPVLKSKVNKSPWTDLVPEMENRIKVLTHSRDSMLEDSNLQDEEFEQNVLLNLSDIPEPTLDRITALVDSMPLYFNNNVSTEPIIYNSNESLSRAALEEAINYLNIQRDIEEDSRQAEIEETEEDSTSWEDVGIDESQEEEEEEAQRDLPY